MIWRLGHEANMEYSHLIIRKNKTVTYYRVIAQANERTTFQNRQTLVTIAII